MKYNYSNLKQEFSLPYLKTSFFAALFTTLITTSVNIAKDSNGIVYTVSKNIYLSVFGQNFNTGFFIDGIKNVISIFTRCVDVALSVLAIFFIIYFVARLIQKNIYNKTGKKRRAYLSELLWKNIVPNILEANEIETKFIMNSSQSVEIEKNLSIIKLSTVLKSHKEITDVVDREGIFEYISNNNVDKRYLNLLNEIDFQSIYILFCTEAKTVSLVQNKLSSLEAKDELLNELEKGYIDIKNKYDNLINILRTNKYLV